MTLSGLFSRMVSSGRRLLVVSSILLAGWLPRPCIAVCNISGPSEFCSGSTNTFVATPSFSDPSPGYSWSISSNTAQAVFLSDTNLASVQVLAGTNGTFELTCEITSEVSETCTNHIVVHSVIASSSLSDQTVCSNAAAVFSTQPDGDGPFSFVWRKDGELLSWADTNSITISNVTEGDLGQYCVEVSGLCNTVTNCAMLGFIPAPTLTCPSNLVVNCPQEVPDPDTNSVMMTGGTNIVFAGDVVTTNICGLSIHRTYESFNSCGISSTCSQVILVANTNAPTLSCGTNHSVECGTPWDFTTPSAIDFCGTTNVLITILNTETNPLVGGTFSAKRTWIATDSCSNSMTCTQTVTLIDTTPPQLSCSSNIVAECAGAAGTQVTFVTTAVDTCDTNITVVCTPPSGSFFPLGSNTVFCSVTDSSGNSNSCSFSVTVHDTTAPEITCSTNIIAECAGAAGTQVTFVSTALDTCDTNITVVCTPPSGSFFPLGSNTVFCSVTDSSGNSNSCSFSVTVRDTIAPEITCSSNIVAECAGPGGTAVTFVTTAVDTCDTNVTVVCTPPSGSLFSLGPTTVFCTATDGSGNSNSCSFTVTVRDTTPPQITCPSNMNVAEAPRDSGFATVVYPAPIISDICDNDLTVQFDPPSGSSLPVGTNMITCTVVDHSGNSNSCPFTVRVIPYRLRVTVTSTNDSGPETLRQALLDANDSPDENLVVFNLPVAPATIHLLSALPEITSGVIIDGWSQPGFSGRPLIELDGSTVSNGVPGLVLLSPSNTIRGLALHGFTTAIQVETKANIIEGNFIGTDLTGTNLAGNLGDGIRISSPGNLIGGTNPVSANNISGNASNGIVFITASASNNVVEGNLITFNGANGIALDASARTGNGVLGNVIFQNQGLGIDLGNNGVTPNDEGDQDVGPNNYQNFPVLTDAQSSDGVTTIFGELDSANTVYHLDFFLNNTPDPSGHGEAEVFLGSKILSVHGNGPETFKFSFPVSATYTQYITATATGPFNDTSEFSQAIQVRTPPVLGDIPLGTNAPAGAPATFCASASGTPPITFQWRLNGFNIPGATNACFTISAADVTNGGSYTVLIGNGLGALATIPASLTLPLLARNGADNFENRVSLQGLNGVVEGQNRGATFQHDEPLHAGKFGGKSVWYTWTAPVTGVATFRTLGSSFDTLIAIYSGTSISNLTTIDSDEDRGGFYTSKTEFNAIKNNQYQIAIDGYDGAEGDFVLQWSEQDTPHLEPRFQVQPKSQTVAPGSDVTFSAVAVRVCGNGHENCPIPDHYPEGTLPGLTYQWYYFDSPIAGATSNVFTIVNAQRTNSGIYTIRVSTLWQTVESQDAVLQFNSTDSSVENALATDKFGDATNPLFLGAGGPTNVSFNESQFAASATAGSSVVSGYSGTQIFNTVGSATSPGEIICGVIGGASEWISLVAQETGNVYLNTDGSSYDTVVAVFRRSPTNSAVLQLLACDNNSGTNGLTSSLSFPVVAGQTNYIDVDGVNGATGILQLNFSLATSTILKSAGVTAQGAQRLQVMGRPNLHFALQASTNFSAWTTLVTTNSTTSVFEYIDLDSVTMPKRYYRALILP